MIEEKQLKLIPICRFSDFKRHDQREDGNFGREYSQVGGQLNTLNRVIPFTDVDSILHRYV